MNNAKQLTWQQAEELASNAADKALGVCVPERTAKISVTVGAVERVAQRAVVIALREAGLLVTSDAADQRRIEQKANDAQRRHNAFRRTSGANC